MNGDCTSQNHHAQFIFRYLTTKARTFANTYFFCSKNIQPSSYTLLFHRSIMAIIPPPNILAFIE